MPGHTISGQSYRVTFKDGINGKGGMLPSFCLKHHGPRKLRVGEMCGLVFGSFSNAVSPLE
jgi:ferredoxin